MALQPVDLVVALAAARARREHGEWHPTSVQVTLGLAWSSLDRSLARLRSAGVVRGDQVSLVALAALLPVTRYLFPLEVDTNRMERGVPTGYASPAFKGRIRYEAAQVWSDVDGPVIGHPVQPLHRNITDIARRDPGLRDVFSLVDAIRGGRAREVGIASAMLRDLLGLPAPFPHA